MKYIAKRLEEGTCSPIVEGLLIILSFLFPITAIMFISYIAMIIA